jgi:predicted TIM-barrel fold metal-dependent hydrolase
VERLMIFSSDGHATARMPDFRPYLPASLREDFDAFCTLYAEKGSKNFEPRALRFRIDDEMVDEWEEGFHSRGRLDGYWNIDRRLKELDAEGVSGEVLFPDFGLPFELYGSPTQAASMGEPPLSPEMVEIRNQAFNRWLVDFIADHPERFAGMALVSFVDVERALAQIRWAKEAGLRGIVLPHFPEDRPVYHPRHERIWALLADLGMPVNAHSAFSSTLDRTPKLANPPHVTCALGIYVPLLFFFCRQLLAHLIWGGVLERHPGLTAVFTEMHTGWVVSELALMDHQYEESFLRRDVHDALPHLPSEYFRRQVFMGSSLLSRAEVEAREVIGVEKMMLGVDYPHHEGWLLLGVREYLRETLGVFDVPPDEARAMLGRNAARVFGMDEAKLQAIADETGIDADDALAPPPEHRRPRGDITRPLG